jgi:aryl-alcohol dehydrogenase-like predicted oxidoreductase
MKYRPLGHTGLKVSEISLGSWTTLGGSVDESTSARLIHHAFAQGINLFDTADVYGRGTAERALGKALESLPREQVVVATKVMGRVWEGPLGAGLSRKHIFDAVEQSLTRLGLDYIDLYQFHAPDRDTPLEESVRAFEDLVRSGKVRYLGFSNFERPPALDLKVLAIQKARGWDRIVSSQPRYNLIDRHIEDAHLAFCRKNGIGLIVYSPLAQGVLTNKYAAGARPEGSRATGNYANFLTAEKALTEENVAAAERFAAWVEKRGIGTPSQVALAWVLRRPEVSSAIIGASRIEQLEENLKASDLELGPKDWLEAEAAIRGSRHSSAAKGTKKGRPKKRR